jgi:hypothetical protein
LAFLAEKKNYLNIKRKSLLQNLQETFFIIYQPKVTDRVDAVSDVGIPHEKAEKHASFFDYIESQPLVEQRDTKCCLSEASSLSN